MFFLNRYRRSLYGEQFVDIDDGTEFSPKFQIGKEVNRVEPSAVTKTCYI